MEHQPCGDESVTPDGLSRTALVRTSRMAQAAAVCALVGPVCPIVGCVFLLVSWGAAWGFGMGFLAGLVLSALALVLGLVALARIGLSGGRLTGYGFAVVAVIIPSMELLAVWYLTVPIRAMDKCAACGRNLSDIGKAMLLYANDYEDRLPLAGGQDTTWASRLNDWSAASRSEAFGLDPNNSGGQATISSSFYLLVRYKYLSPKVFVCPSDRRTRRFDPNQHLAARKDLTMLWDFGPDPVRHCSYAYQMVYGRHKLTTSNEPGIAIAADRNPWMDSPSAGAGDFSGYKPDIPSFGGNSDDAKRGNGISHDRDGQNVLFLDSHVEFAKRAYCGLDDDNIYTISTSQTSGDPMGTPPVFGSRPANKRDSLLVNDPIVPRR